MLVIFINKIKQSFRRKFDWFWMLIFPVLLGTLFHVAFGGMLDDGKLENIDVAVTTIEEQTSDDATNEDDSFSFGVGGPSYEESITEILNSIDTINPHFASYDEAMELLKDGEVDGVYVIDANNSVLNLTIDSNHSEEATMRISILGIIADKVNGNYKLVEDTIVSHPEHLQAVISELENTYEYATYDNLTDSEDSSLFTVYFHNLIAMTCLYSCTSGIVVAGENQANLSPLAARKALSSTKRHKFIIAELAATYLVNVFFIVLGYLYLTFILDVGMGNNLGLELLTILLSTMLGISFGYFMGSIGKKSISDKVGLSFAITMPLCFLSGLMVANMKGFVYNACPIVNKINPAALISDCFYQLENYNSTQYYWNSMLAIACMTIVFVVLGLFMTRRTKYANL